MTGIRSSFVLLTILGTHAVGSSEATAGPAGPGEGVTVVADQATPQTPAEKALRKRAEELARDASERFTEIMSEKDGGGAPAAGGTAQTGGEDHALAPVWDWLTRASKDYQDVIIAKFKNPSGEVAILTPPGTVAAAPAPSAAVEEATEPSRQLGWSSLVESVREWLARATRSYRTEIVKRLVRPREPEAPARAVAAAVPQPEAAPQTETAPQPAAVPPAGSSEVVAVPERKAKALGGAASPADTRPAEAAAQAKRKEAEAAADAKRKADAEAAAAATRKQEAEAEARRKAEAAAGAKRRQAEAAAEAERKAEAEAEARRKAEAAAEAKRMAEAEAEAKRKAEAAAEARRKAEAAAETERKAAAAAAAEAKRVAEAAADAKRKAEAAAEAKRREEEAAEAKREAEAAAEAERSAKAADEETRQAEAATSPPRAVTPPVKKEAAGAGVPKAREETVASEPPPGAEKKRVAEVRIHKHRYKRHRRHAQAIVRHGKRSRMHVHAYERRHKAVHRRHYRFRPRHCGRGHVRRAWRGRVHVVRRGDTLSGIAKRYYGHGGRYTRIYRANRGKIRNPNLIYPRQRLYIP